MKRHHRQNPTSENPIHVGAQHRCAPACPGPNIISARFSRFPLNASPPKKRANRSQVRLALCFLLPQPKAISPQSACALQNQKLAPDRRTTAPPLTPGAATAASPDPPPHSCCAWPWRPPDGCFPPHVPPPPPSSSATYTSSRSPLQKPQTPPRTAQTPPPIPARNTAEKPPLHPRTTTATSCGNWWRRLRCSRRCLRFLEW